MKAWIKILNPNLLFKFHNRIFEEEKVKKNFKEELTFFRCFHCNKSFLKNKTIACQKYFYKFVCFYFVDHFIHSNIEYNKKIFVHVLYVNMP